MEAPALGAQVALARRHCRERRKQTAIIAPLSGNTTETLEPRAETDPKNLRLVESFLADRIGEIKSNRTDRRLPRHTYTGACTDRRRLLDHRLTPPCCRQLGGCQYDIRRFDMV